MRFWVGITDKEWFDFLAPRTPEEVNFWQPSAATMPRFLAPGVPFLFKLHAPLNYIVGGGFFVRFSVLPSRMAWEAFGEKNGVPDYSALRRRIAGYRDAVRGDPEIGCNVLNEPFFWPRGEWITVPAAWPRNTVRGKTYDTANAEGAALWDEVHMRLRRQAVALDPVEEANRYGSAYLTSARLGQGTFRVLVTEAYARRCAITGERTLPALEAAHIRPFSDQGPHRISNGLLLRADLHKLFDDGYLTVSEDLRIEVSRRIKEEFENGRAYYALHGERLQVVPRDPSDQPARDFLRWHNSNCYLG
jgi:putative restriction endonuclease